MSVLTLDDLNLSQAQKQTLVDEIKNYEKYKSYEKTYEKKKKSSRDNIIDMVGGPAKIELPDYELTVFERNYYTVNEDKMEKHEPVGFKNYKEMQEKYKEVSTTVTSIRVTD